jgi:hypothetical protein
MHRICALYSRRTNSPAGQAAPNHPKSTNPVLDPMTKHALFTLSPAAALADYGITAMRDRQQLL